MKEKKGEQRVKEKPRGSGRIRGRQGNMSRDNEKCSCHLLVQTSASERDFKITFTREPTPQAGGRIRPGNFIFITYKTAVCLLMCRGDISFAIFPEHNEMENAGRRQIFIALSSELSLAIPRERTDSVLIHLTRI